MECWVQNPFIMDHSVSFSCIGWSNELISNIKIRAKFAEIKNFSNIRAEFAEIMIF